MQEIYTKHVAWHVTAVAEVTTANKNKILDKNILNQLLLTTKTNRF